MRSLRLLVTTLVLFAANPASGAPCSDDGDCTTPPACRTATGATCNPETGACTYPALASGTSCSDGNACNGSETCADGTCAAGSPVTCTTPPACRTATGATCDPETGACTYPALATGTSCSDGNACNGSETCADGTCAAGSPVTCTTPPVCRTATGATCNPETGACTYPALATGTSCSDGNRCNGEETCVDASCVTSGPAPCRDHFLCWKAVPARARRDAPPYPKFEPRAGVQVVDRISSSDASDPRRIDLRKAVVVCNPADKNGEAPGAPSHPDHLEGYAASPSKHPRQSRLATRTLAVTNQLGSLLLTISRPDALLVPSTKTKGGDGAPPSSDTALDHFRCYRVSVAKRTAAGAAAPSFAPIEVEVTDQLVGPLVTVLTKPTLLCAPADKNGEDPTAPQHEGHLLCYAAKVAKNVLSSARPREQLVSTHNQFGDEVLLAKKLSSLCIPTRVVAR